MFQNPKSQFFNIDSDSEITFGLENAGVEPKKIKERYEATVSALKIQSLLGRNIFSMSGEMCIRDRLIVLFVAPIIGGIIGAFIARGLFKKHFVKAGIV